MIVGFCISIIIIFYDKHNTDKEAEQIEIKYNVEYLGTGNNNFSHFKFKDGDNTCYYVGPREFRFNTQSASISCIKEKEYVHY
ncbi:MAG: hypothetical protein LC122_14285 [Chitinophagales bacterium]|nr:hypothetical protein [Chitinophagales bacterium]